MGYRYQTADAIGRHIGGRILVLQREYLAGMSSARGTLARLRRIDTLGGGSWMLVGEELFANLPDYELSVRDQERLMEAAKISLKLYAVHQQSKPIPMAIVPEGGLSSSSFGSACWAIVRNDDRGGAAGVRRRMALIEAASDMRGIESCMRQLVLQMKSENVPLNYSRLVSDLYLLQFDGERDKVLMEWARDYYAPQRGQKEGRTPSKDEAASKSERV